MKTSNFRKEVRRFMLQYSVHKLNLKQLRRLFLQSKEVDPTLPLEHCREYDAAAEWCARYKLTGSIGTPLPANMGTDGALRYINADPEAFESRVRQFAYRLAMESRV